MSIIQFIQRSQQLLLNPAAEFERISEEPPVRGTIFRRFVIPWAILIGLFAILGNSLTNVAASFNSYFFVVLNGVLVFLIVLVHSYLSSRVIRMLGRNLESSTSDYMFIRLAIYSQIPLFLVYAVIKLFPSLYFLYFLALYCSLIFYAGTATMGMEQNDERVRFTLISILLMIVSFVLTSLVFTVLYNEIIHQFSTFAAL